MCKNRFNLRNVIAIAICLAGITMFFGCDDRKSGSEFKNLGFVAPDRTGDPYIYVNLKSGSSLAFYTNVETGNVKSAIYENGRDVLLIRYGEDDLPLGAYGADKYCLFSYSENTITAEFYNAEKQKIDETVLQGKDIAELIDNSSNLRRAFEQPCGSKVFALKKARMLKRFIEPRVFGKITLKQELEGDGLFNDFDRASGIEICLDEELERNFQKYYAAECGVECMINRHNGNLKDLMEKQKVLLKMIQDKYPDTSANIDSYDISGFVNPDLTTSTNPGGGNDADLCAINGSWSGTQTYSGTISCPGFSEDYGDTDDDFWFVVENCKIESAATPPGFTVSFDGSSMTGNEVKIYMTSDDDDGANTTITYTGQLNAAKNKISGTLTGVFLDSDDCIDSFSGTWEVAKQ